MTAQGDPLTRRQAYPSHAVKRRNKLAPDPDVRRAIVAAASKTNEHIKNGLVSPAYAPADLDLV
jgi:hypothetical protein